MTIGVTSTENTTSTPLSGGATFTGAAETNYYPDAMVSCYSDTNGTLYFDFSVDGTNWRTFPTAGFAVTGGIHEFHTAVKGPRYFRVRFVNGSSAQSIFQLYTYYGTFRQPNAPLNQAISLDSDGLSVRPSSFQDEVRIGRRTGVEGWNKFSYRTGLTAANGEETVWAASGNFTPMTSAGTFDISYNSSTDGAGGSATGAEQLAFYYIDSDGLPAVAIHTLGSDGSDTTSFSGLGINRIAVSASGSAKKNNSDITVTATSGGSTQATVPAGYSVTQQAIFFVGSNHLAVAKWLWINVLKISGGGSPRVTVRGYVYNRAVDTTYLIFQAKIDTSVKNDLTIEDPIGFNLNSTDVLYFVADTDTNSTDIDLRFSLNQYQKT